MSGAISEAISGFRSQIENRRFGDGTLRILESVLVSKDVRSLMETRSALRDLLRSSAVSVLREIKGKGTYEKLCVVEFFVRAFALIGDVESCLALKYEGLILRELRCMNDISLQVSYEEWLTFAKDSLDNGFYSIAVKGFDNALKCFQHMNATDTNLCTFFTQAKVVENIKQLRDMALELVSSNSVQTLTAEYLREKAIQQAQKCSSCLIGTRYPSSSSFRRGIKTRNMQKLLKSQASHQETNGS